MTTANALTVVGGGSARLKVDAYGGSSVTIGGGLTNASTMLAWRSATAT